jgi:hypothetical protein
MFYVNSSSASKPSSSSSSVAGSALLMMPARPAPPRPAAPLVVPAVASNAGSSQSQLIDIGTSQMDATSTAVTASKPLGNWEVFY